MAMPYKGVRTQATVRIPVDLHRAAAVEARKRRWSMNELICQAVREMVGETDEVSRA